MLGRLPDRIEPLRLAGTGSSLHGTVALSRMARLAPALRAIPIDAAEVRIDFGIDEQGTRYARGTIAAELELTCQRCLGALRHPVAIEFALGLVSSAEQGERLGQRYEPLITDGEPLALAELVEDELILALPIVALHEQGCCSAPAGPQGSPDEETRAADAAANPFAVLSRLKGKH